MNWLNAPQTPPPAKSNSRCYKEIEITITAGVWFDYMPAEPPERFYPGADEDFQINSVTVVDYDENEIIEELANIRNENV